MYEAKPTWEKVLRIQAIDGLNGNDFETTTKFNKAFQSVFIKEPQHYATNFDVNYSGPKIEDIIVDPNKVKNIFKAMSTKPWGWTVSIRNCWLNVIKK